MNLQKSDLKIGFGNVFAGQRAHHAIDSITSGVRWRKNAPDRAFAWMQSHANDVDVWALQELDEGSWRTNQIHQTEWLASQSQYPFWAHQTNRRLANFSSTANAIISRIPIKTILDYPLPGRILGGRGLLSAQLVFENRSVWIHSTHLALSENVRRMQIKVIAEALKNHPGPHLLLGDFNQDSRDSAFRPFWEMGAKEVIARPTFPRWNPRRYLDHAWQFGGDAALIELFPLGASDHLGGKIHWKV